MIEYVACERANLAGAATIKLSSEMAAIAPQHGAIRPASVCTGSMACGLTARRDRDGLVGERGR